MACFLFYTDRTLNRLHPEFSFPFFVFFSSLVLRYVNTILFFPNANISFDFVFNPFFRIKKLTYRNDKREKKKNMSSYKYMWPIQTNLSRFSMENPKISLVSNLFFSFSLLLSFSLRYVYKKTSRYF